MDLAITRKGSYIHTAFSATAASFLSFLAPHSVLSQGCTLTASRPKSLTSQPFSVMQFSTPFLWPELIHPISHQPRFVRVFTSLCLVCKIPIVHELNSSISFYAWTAETSAAGVSLCEFTTSDAYEALGAACCGQLRPSLSPMLVHSAEFKSSFLSCRLPLPLESQQMTCFLLQGENESQWTRTPLLTQHDAYPLAGI